MNTIYRCRTNKSHLFKKESLKEVIICPKCHGFADKLSPQQLSEYKIIHHDDNSVVTASTSNLDADIIDSIDVVDSSDILSKPSSSNSSDNCSGSGGDFGGGGSSDSW